MRTRIRTVALAAVLIVAPSVAALGPGGTALAAVCNGQGGYNTPPAPQYAATWAALLPSAANNCRIATGVRVSCPSNNWWLNSNVYVAKGSVSNYNQFYVGGCSGNPNGWYTKQV